MTGSEQNDETGQLFSPCRCRFFHTHPPFPDPMYKSAMNLWYSWRALCISCGKGDMTSKKGSKAPRPAEEMPHLQPDALPARIRLAFSRRCGRIGCRSSAGAGGEEWADDVVAGQGEHAVCARELPEPLAVDEHKPQVASSSASPLGGPCCACLAYGVPSMLQRGAHAVAPRAHAHSWLGGGERGAAGFLLLFV